MQLKESASRCQSRASASAALTWRPCHEQRPKVLLAHADRAYRLRAREQFRDGDVELVTATSADEVYRLARQLRPKLVVLDADLPDESGYLACAKIKLVSPRCKVVVLADESGENERFARFAGAELLVGRSPEGSPSLASLAAWAC